MCSSSDSTDRPLRNQTRPLRPRTLRTPPRARAPDCARGRKRIDWLLSREEDQHRSGSGKRSDSRNSCRTIKVIAVAIADAFERRNDRDALAHGSCSALRRSAQREDCCGVHCRDCLALPRRSSDALVQREKPRACDVVQTPHAFASTSPRHRRGKSVASCPFEPG